MKAHWISVLNFLTESSHQTYQSFKLSFEHLNFARLRSKRRRSDPNVSMKGFQWKILNFRFSMSWRLYWQVYGISRRFRSFFSELWTSVSAAEHLTASTASLGQVDEGFSQSRLFKSFEPNHLIPVKLDLNPFPVHAWVCTSLINFWLSKGR